MRVFKIAFALSTGGAILILAYGTITSLLQHPASFGQTLVNTEFPPQNPLYISLKPISWLVILVLISWYSFFRLSDERLSRVRSSRLAIIELVFLLFALTSLYETIYNFTIWNVLMNAQQVAGQLNPDVLANNFPSPTHSYNLAFETKAFVTILFCSIYGFLVIHGHLNRSRERNSPQSTS